MTKQELKTRMLSFKDWRHRIDLGQDIITPGEFNPQITLQGIEMPEDLSGKSVLDVGALDGFFSFEAEKRGAARILAIDIWGSMPRVDKVRFDFVAEVLNSKVESKIMSVYDLSPETVGAFDITFFLGVIYHLRHPLLALEKIASVTKEMLILESHVLEQGNSLPSLVFYADGKSGHKVNYNEPNMQCLKEMIKDVGFKRIKNFGIYHGSRVAMHAWK